MAEINYLDHVLQLAAAGFRVFPLRPKDKKPLAGSSGCTEATTDTEQLCRWWEKHPTANIGLATGRTSSDKYLTVIDLDIDKEKGKDGFAECYEWQKENNLIFPETLTVKTGRGGLHLFFYTDEEFRNTTNLLPAVDVRGEGGYIVAPPSIHPNGNRYEFNGEFDPSRIAAANEAVLAFLKYKKPKAAKSEQKQEPKPVIANASSIETYIAGLDFSEGNRNTNLHRLTSSLQARGYEDSDILRIVEQTNSERCSPPLSGKEIETIVRSVTEHYIKGIPRTLAAINGDWRGHSERIAAKYPYIIPKINGSGEITYSVHRPKLAAFVRAHDRYFFLDTHGEKPIAFWYEGGCYKQCSDNEFKGHIKAHIAAFSEELVATKDLDEVFKLLLTDNKTVSASELDNNPDLICFRNGLLNIRTLQLSPHTPELLCTVQIPCEWLGQADCPTFKGYLETLSGGNSMLQFLLWEYLGLIISNIEGYKPKQALFLKGAGNTGKSQYLELAKRLVGAVNFVSMDIRQLEERFGTASLWRKRLAGSPDMSAINAKELAVFKKLTGGDDIDFEFKGKDKFTDKFRGVLLFCANEMPKFGGDKGEHVYERMIIVPCENVIPPELRDPQIIEKLYAERCGIVYEAVRYLQRFIRNGYKFDIPDICRYAGDSYKVENDNVLQFLAECTEPRQNSYDTTTGQMYTAYKNWAKDNGLFVHSNQDFKKSLCGYFKLDKSQLERKDRTGKRFYSFELTWQSRKDLLHYTG